MSSVLDIEGIFLTSAWRATLNIIEKSRNYKKGYFVPLLLVLMKKDLISNLDSNSNEIIKDLNVIIDELDNNYSPIKDFFYYFELNKLELSDNYINTTVEVFRNDIKSDYSNLISAFNISISNIAEYNMKSKVVNNIPFDIIKTIMTFNPDINNARVYNPYVRDSRFSLVVGENSTYFGQEPNKELFLIGQLQKLMYDIPTDRKITMEDPVKAWPNETEKFDFIVGIPPFDTKFKPSVEEYRNVKTISSYVIKRSMINLSNNGRAAIILPFNFLFSNTDKDIRKEIIDNDLLDLVIGLPIGVFQEVSMPTVLIVLSKKKGNPNMTLFIDTRDCYDDISKIKKQADFEKINALISLQRPDEKNHVANIDELKENDYNLNISRYVRPDIKVSNSDSFIALKELLTPIKNRKSIFFELGKRVRLSNLKNNPFDFKTSFSDILDEEPERMVTIEKSALLLALKGNHLKPTYFEHSEQDIFINPNHIIALDVDKEMVNLDYLIYCLHSDTTNWQLDKYREGINILSINRKDLLSIEIPLPSLDEQREIVVNSKLDFISKEEDRLVSLRQDLGVDVDDQNSFLRHQIAGRFSNVRSAFSKIVKVLDKANVYSLKLNPDNPRILKDYIEMVSRDLDAINTSILRSGKELELENLNLEEVDVEFFTAEYFANLENRSNNMFEIFVSFNKNFGDIDTVQNGEFFINIDKNLITEIFDNIIDNAVKHGFNNEKSINNRIQFELYLDYKKDELQINISNTGKPFPKNFDLNDYIRKGSKSGVNSGDGFGGWYINKVMELHNGRLNISTEAFTPTHRDFEFVSTIELYFPFEIK